jgi:hypothetical protein
VLASLQQRLASVLHQGSPVIKADFKFLQCDGKRLDDDCTYYSSRETIACDWGDYSITFVKNPDGSWRRQVGPTATCTLGY